MPVVRRLVGEGTLALLDKARADGGRKSEALADAADALASAEPRPWEQPALRGKFAEAELHEHVAAMRAELGLG